MTAFNPLIATTKNWEEFLLDGDNHTPDYLGDVEGWPPNTKLQQAVQVVTEGNLKEATQRAIVARAVKAAIGIWDVLAAYEVSFRTGGTHPFIPLPDLAYSGKNPVPALVSITQLLWHRAPKVFNPEDFGFINLLRGLREHVPLSNDELEGIYLNHFNIYKFDVIEILLRRKDTKRARCLFLQRVADYPDVDGLCMDHLIYHGLPIEDAQIWLAQGINGEPSHVKPSAHALNRWQNVAAQRPG